MGEKSIIASLYRTPVDSTVEIHAQGRCLGVAPPARDVSEAPHAIGLLPLPPAAGWLVLLEPCDGTTFQRFYAPEVNGIFPMNNTNLRVTVEGANSANRTPLVLEPPSASVAPGQAWTLVQYDMTAYSYPPDRKTAGSYTFQGLGGKCIDVGGVTPPDHSPVYLYGCNSSIAQVFGIKAVNEPLGYYTIRLMGGVSILPRVRLRSDRRSRSIRVPARSRKSSRLTITTGSRPDTALMRWLRCQVIAE